MAPPQLRQQTSNFSFTSHLSTPKGWKAELAWKPVPPGLRSSTCSGREPFGISGMGMFQAVLHLSSNHQCQSTRGNTKRWPHPFFHHHQSDGRSSCPVPLPALEQSTPTTWNQLTPHPTLVAWSSGRALVFGRCAIAVLRSTCSWWVTTYVSKPSAIGQPTRPTQPFILSGLINE